MNDQVEPESVQTTAAPRAPAGSSTPSGSAATSAPDLPPIAEKASDLEWIKKAVDDAASVGGGLWLSYLFLMFYLAVAAGRVTHADLFVENPVKLPFLNIDLPLLAFFIIAPILFLIVHACVLVHLVFLSDKATVFDSALREQIGGNGGLPEGESERRETIRTGLRRQLPSNVFVQFIAGPAHLRKGVFGRLLRAIAWVTLVIAPVSLLLLIQIQFLPYHSTRITWWHRIALLADLGLDLVLVAQNSLRVEASRFIGMDSRWSGPDWLRPSVLGGGRDVSRRRARILSGEAGQGRGSGFVTRLGL